MMEFGGYNIYIIYFTIVIGSLLGCIINFGVGKILSTQFKLENAFYKDYLLILSGVPIFGEMITMAAGLFQTKLKRMILFVTISKMIYFMLQLML
jgi:membrane protein YqaA with SNARE-associated domain